MVYEGRYAIKGIGSSVVFCDDRKTATRVLFERLENEELGVIDIVGLWIIPHPGYGDLSEVMDNLSGLGAVIMYKDDVQYIDVPAKE